MNIQDCIKFANENRASFLSTMEGHQPLVRGLGFWFADETGFYFQTSTVKDVYRQLKNNPRAEACFYKPEDPESEMWRVAGSVEFMDTPELRKKCLQERPYLKSMGITENSPELVIFRIPSGEATFWHMENNMKPKEMFQFGQDPPEENDI